MVSVAINLCSRSGEWEKNRRNKADLYLLKLFMAVFFTLSLEKGDLLVDETTGKQINEHYLSSVFGQKIVIRNAYPWN